MQKKKYYETENVHIIKVYLKTFRKAKAGKTFVIEINKSSS